MSNTKMIYNDDQSIGVDEQSLQQLMNILTPRMKTQLAKSLHNKVVKLMDNHNNSEVKQWAATLKKEIINS